MTKIFRKINLSTVDSTNNFAANLLNQNLGQDNMVIMADFQTGGKGQQGNTWSSERGLNLTFSIIKRFDMLSVHEKARLIWAVSLSILKLLSKNEIEAQVKWPNDIMVGTSKIAGVLIENRLRGFRIEWSILGIGLNVNQQEFASKGITSMYKISNRKFERDELITQFMNELTPFLSASFEALKENYNQNLYLIGKNSTFRDKHGFFEGTILGVNDEGLLMIQKSNQKILEYNLKEVIFQNDL